MTALELGALNTVWTLLLIQHDQQNSSKGLQDSCDPDRECRGQPCSKITTPAVAFSGSRGVSVIALTEKFSKYTKTFFRIFVPSSRNRLADILLGKASPVKKLSRRSTSASPSKGRGKAITPVQSLVPDTPVMEFKCRRSPRKQIKDVSVTNGDGELTGKFRNEVSILTFTNPSTRFFKVGYQQTSQSLTACWF